VNKEEVEQPFVNSSHAIAAVDANNLILFLLRHMFDPPPLSQP
jgi:hypothetical protein